jgi:hypothetical protein
MPPTKKKKKKTKKSSSPDLTSDRKVGYLTFHIFGDDFTRIVRTLMMEGNWVKALNLIVEGIQGISWEQAIEILECRAALEGDNRFMLVEDDPKSEDNKRYVDQYEWLWAGALKYQDHYFQPYARVFGWGRPDLDGPEFNMYQKNRHPRKRRIGASIYSTAWRSLTYADSPTHDICMPVKPVDGDNIEFGQSFDVFILFREITMPPVWRECTIRPQEAYASYVKLRKHGLPVRGAKDLIQDEAETYSVWQEDDDYARDEDPDLLDAQDKIIAKHESKEGPLASLAAMAAANFGIPIDVVQGTLDVVTGAVDDESEPIATRETGPNGYVLRNGAFYPCNYHAHSALAKRLLKWALVDGDPTIEDPEKHIEQKCGVARLSTGPAGGPRYQYMKKPTKAQEKTVVDWCLKYQVPYTGYRMS